MSTELRIHTLGIIGGIMAQSINNPSLDFQQTGPISIGDRQKPRIKRAKKKIGENPPELTGLHETMLGSLMLIFKSVKIICFTARVTDKIL